MALSTVLPAQDPAAQGRKPLFAHILAQAEKGVVPHCWIPVGAPSDLLEVLYADPAGPHPEFEVVPFARAVREVRS